MTRRLADLRLERKLLIGFLLVSSLAALVGGIGLHSLSVAQQRINTMYVDSTMAIADLGTIRTGFERSRLLVINLALDPSPEAERALVAEMAEVDAGLDERWSAYVATDMRGRERFRDQFAAALGTWREARATTMLPPAQAGQQARFLQALAAAQPAADEARAGLQGLVEVEDAAAKTAIETARGEYDGARTLVLAVLVVALLLGVVLARTIGRLVARPLRRTVQVLQGLAEGRLDRRLEVDTRDEVGEMGTALNAALDRLSGVVSDIAATALSLTGASTQLESTSESLSASAQHCAAQAGTAAAASQEVSSSVRTIALGGSEMGTAIHEIAQSANEASRAAGTAVQVVGDTNESVSKLGESSRQIDEVIKVITSIAEQTNLLALNATIEAARAGEYGKGFAVVASEVKDLAQETARATEDISQKIATIQQDTSTSVSAIARISTVIGEMNDSQNTIASAVEEQTATTQEMNRNVTHAADAATDIATSISQVAEAAQDTTRGAHDTAQAATDLSGMARDLQRLVDQFVR